MGFMKKLIIRIFAAVIFIGLLIINIESHSDLKRGVQEAKALPGNEVTCWSQIKKKDNVATIWCSGCAGMMGWKDDGGQGTCVQSNPGEN